MGAKLPSVRTLKSGEKVTHYPSGEQVLLPTTQVADVLDAGEDVRRYLDAEKLYHRLTAVEEKRERQAQGRPVPSDKSPI